MNNLRSNNDNRVRSKPDWSMAGRALCLLETETDQKALRQRSINISQEHHPFIIDPRETTPIRPHPPKIPKPQHLASDPTKVIPFQIPIPLKPFRTIFITHRNTTNNPHHSTTSSTCILLPHQVSTLNSSSNSTARFTTETTPYAICTISSTTKDCLTSSTGTGRSRSMIGKANAKSMRISWKGQSLILSRRSIWIVGKE